jgi:hypothetical protein
MKELKALLNNLYDLHIKEEWSFSIVRGESFLVFSRNILKTNYTRFLHKLHLYDKVWATDYSWAYADFGSLYRSPPRCESEL